MLTEPHDPQPELEGADASEEPTISETALLDPPRTVAPWQVGALAGLSVLAAGGFLVFLAVAGYRVLVPGLGATVYTSTALASVMLAAVGVGGVLGGRLADDRANTTVLGFLLVMAGVCMGATPLIQPVFIKITSGADVLVASLVAAAGLFTMPSLFLGMAVAYAQKLLADASGAEHAGQSTGVVMIVGGVGAFLGLIVTGFWLIPTIGVGGSFLGSGIILAGFGCINLAVRNLHDVGPAALCVLVVVSGGIIVNTWRMDQPVDDRTVVLWSGSSSLHDIRIVRTRFDRANALHEIIVDGEVEGSMLMPQGGIAGSYERYWELARIYTPDLRRAIFLGAGSFAMPQQIAQWKPEAWIEVVEADEAIVDLGKPYFRLGASPSIQTHVNDPRRFLTYSAQRYNLIVNLACHGVGPLPEHLLTDEFMAIIRERLDDDGVYMLRLTVPLEGDHGRMFRRIHATVQKHLPHVDLYAARSQRLDEPTSAFIVASPAPLVTRREEAQVTGGVRDLMARRLPPAAYVGDGATPLTDNRPALAIAASRLRAIQPR